MDFSYTEEQTLLKDTLTRFVQKDYPFDARHQRIKNGVLCHQETWSALAEMGVLALNVPEAAGGLGASSFETHIVMESVGEGLILEPFLASAVLGTHALALASPLHPLLEKAATGEIKLAFAYTEPGQRYERTYIGDQGTHFRHNSLTGSKVVVLGGAVADYLVVTGFVDGVTAFFLVDAKANGISRHVYPTQDGSCGADFVFNNVAAERLGSGDHQHLIDAVLDKACAALCAEAVGAMGVMHKLTVEYLKTRKQFGVTLSNFQVLKHRAADMLVQLELAKSMSLYATTAADNSDAIVRARQISAARVQVAQAARFVSQQAVQTFGGIGVTDELSVSHYFKRLSIINHTLGDVDWHMARYTKLM